MNISWGNICWFQNMNFSSLNSVTNTSYRNTFCNVAVDYELVAFWRYFINRLFLFHHQIVFYFIIRSFVFHLQTFFISASDFFPRTYNGLPAQMLWHFQLKFQNSINKNWANYSWHFVLKHCFYGIQINSAVHFNLIFLDSDVN